MIGIVEFGIIIEVCVIDGIVLGIVIIGLIG